MHQHNFSQLPYRHDTHGWVLLTRYQVARWLEAQAEEDDIVLGDLSVPVTALADDPRVGPVVPRTLTPASSVVEAIRELEDALHSPDEIDGGYPLVLVEQPQHRKNPIHVFTVADLPRAYDLLGR